MPSPGKTMKRSRIAISLLLTALASVLALMVWLPAQSAAAPIDPVIQHHINDLEDEDHNVRRAAAEALWKLGPEAEPAIPELIEALSSEEDGDVSGRARRALVAIGEPSVEPLVGALRSDDQGARTQAAYALAQMRDKAKAARPALIELLKDKGYTGNWRLEQAITGQGKDVIPDLVKAMDDPDFVVRVRVAGVLSRFGQDGKAAVPVLIEALDHEDATIRRSAVFYLTEMGQAADPALPRLILRLKDDDLETRRDAVRAVTFRGWRDDSAALALVEALQDKQIRKKAAQALADMKNPVAAPALKACLDDDDVGFRVDAAWALVYCKPDAEAVLPVLIDALGNGDISIQSRAAGALRKLGPDAAPAVPALTKALGHQRQDVRFAAVSALREIGPDAEGVIDALVIALDDEYDNVRLGAAISLRYFGPKAKSALPALEGLLDDPDQSVRQEAGWGIKKIRGEPLGDD